MKIIICLFLVFFWILPGLAWLVFQAIVDIRKTLAETRYFNSATKMLCCTECAWEEKV